MAYIKYLPIGNRQPQDLFTTNAPEKQLWQELVMIRHLKNPRGISAKRATSSWFDQAKTYFLDACNADWRSAGLLYYYSFLNLAKAYLAAKRVIPAKILKSSSIYHGLSAVPQTPNQIIDFEVQIHPPTYNNKHNIFATFYERLISKKWPYSQTITAKIAEIIPYCPEISSEIGNFYNINLAIIYVQSLLREVNNHIWLELNLPVQKAAIVQSNLNNINFTIHNLSSLNSVDKSNWLSAYERNMQSLQGTCFLRTQKKSFNQQTRQSVFRQFYQTMNSAFTNYILPIPVAGQHNESWQFIPSIKSNNCTINWHPLLSDYLVAFMLSTILRYHPYLLPLDDKDSFIAEAWCGQSAITALRYFLMSLTTPPLRCN